MTEEVKILHIVDIVSNLDDTQLGMESINDTDLGYKMLCYKDANGNAHKILAKNQDAYIKDLRLTGSTTTGTTGMLKHDTNGDVTGGKITVDTFNNDILSDGPIAGGDLSGSGTVGYLAEFTDTDEVGDSTILHSSNLYLVNGQTTDHSLTDGIVLNQLEVNGNSMFDGVAYFINKARFNDAINCCFGSDEQAKIKWNNVNLSYKHLLVSLDDSSYKTMVLARNSDISSGTDFGSVTDPTLILKAANSTEAERTALSHNLIKSFDGDFKLVADNIIIPSAVDGNSVSSSDDCVVVGTSNTLYEAYTCFVVGNNHNVGGFNNCVVGAYLTATGSYSAVFGQTNSCTGSRALCAGSTNTHSGDYGITVGRDNENSQNYTSVNGRYAKALWDYGSFFSNAKIGSGTPAVGDSQCFQSTMLCRHTEATDTVPLAATGTGTTSGIKVPEGMQISFLVMLHAAYEGSGNGYEISLRRITCSNASSDIIRVDSDELSVNTGGTYTFGWSFSYDETNDFVNINVTPSNAAPANIVAHIGLGTMLKSEQIVS